MKRQLVYCIFIQALVVLGAAQDSLLINEVRVGDSRYEIVNSGSTTVDLSNYKAIVISFASSVKTLKHVDQLTGTINANEIKTISSSAVALGTGGIHGLIIYGAPSSTTISTYGDLTSDKVKDALLYSISPNEANPFSTLIPTWSGSVHYSTTQGISRCANAQYVATSFIGGRSLTFGSANDCPSSGGSGDPHFIQQIIDKKTKFTRNICYDVVGKSENQIDILQDYSTKTKIVGILKDDYYMHIIKITVSHQIFEIFPNYILLPDDTIQQWEGDASQITFGSLSFQISNQQISLSVNRISQQFSFAVTKNLDPLTGWYLNVEFKNLNATESRFGGMMGHVGKKSFAFEESVQNNGQIILRDNNQELKATLKVRSGFKCWFVSFKELIYPKTNIHFVY